jgi:hypothetical protein
MDTDKLFRLLPGSLPGGIWATSIASQAIMHRLDALFRAVASDYLLREQFVTGPSSVILEYVYGSTLAPGQASVSDQLIYAVMSSRPLLEWIHEHSLKYDNSSTRNSYAELFARGVVERGAHRVVVAMMRSFTEGQHPVGLDEVLTAFVHHLHVPTPVLSGDGNRGGGAGGKSAVTEPPQNEEGTGGGDASGASHSENLALTSEPVTRGTAPGPVAHEAGGAGGASAVAERSRVHPATGTLTAITWATYTAGTGPPPPPPSTGILTGSSTRDPTTGTRDTIVVDRLGRRFDPAYVIIGLDALFQYAQILLASGTLDRTFQS